MALPLPPHRAGQAGRALRVVTAGLLLLSFVATSPASVAPAGAIQGGTLLTAEEAPDWAVALRFAYDDGSLGLCSGSLIGPDAVLTAAHCLFDDDGNQHPLSTITAVVGRAELADVSDGVERAVRSITLHPDYRWAAVVVPHDLAVLRIDPVPAHYEVLPISRSAPNALLNPIVFGYGNTDLGDPANGVPSTRSTGLRRIPEHAYFARICVEGPFPVPYSSCLERLKPSVNVLMGDSGAPWVVEQGGTWVQYLLHNGGILEEGFGIATTTGGHFAWIRDTADLFDPPTGSVVRSPSGSDDDGRPPGPAWLIAPDGARRHVADDRTLTCLVDQGATVVEASAQEVQQVPERVGAEADCQPTPECRPDPPADHQPTSQPAGMVNRGFEEGDLRGWIGDPVTEQICAITADEFAEPFDGTHMVRLGRAALSPDDHQPVGPNHLSQAFTADRPTETLAYNFFTYDAGYDRLAYEVTVEDASGQTITIVSRQHPTWGRGHELETTDWQTVEVDLSDHIGQVVTVRFEVQGTGDRLYPSWVYVDIQS